MSIAVTHSLWIHGDETRKSPRDSVSLAIRKVALCAVRGRFKGCCQRVWCNGQSRGQGRSLSGRRSRGDDRLERRDSDGHVRLMVQSSQVNSPKVSMHGRERGDRSLLWGPQYPNNSCVVLEADSASYKGRHEGLHSYRILASAREECPKDEKRALVSGRNTVPHAGVGGAEFRVPCDSSNGKGERKYISGAVQIPPEGATSDDK